MRSHWILYAPQWVQDWWYRSQPAGLNYREMAIDRCDTLSASVARLEHQLKALQQQRSESSISESTVARVAGNIASRLELVSTLTEEVIAERAVRRARAIVAEVRRTGQPR